MHITFLATFLATGGRRSGWTTIVAGGNRVQTKPWHVCFTTGIGRINLRATPSGVDFKMHIIFYNFLRNSASRTMMYYYSISEAIYL